jgi:hypothetical protein
MEDQVNRQLAQIKKQIDLLSDQAKELIARRNAAQEIYGAQMNFEPVMGETYYLYARENGQRVLSMIPPGNWRTNPFAEYLYAVRLLSDNTWEVSASTEQ